MHPFPLNPGYIASMHNNSGYPINDLPQAGSPASTLLTGPHREVETLLELKQAQATRGAQQRSTPTRAGASLPSPGSGAGLLELTEAELIARALKDDLSAFNALVLMHQDGLYGWVLSLVGDEALAEDLTQAAFITAYEKLASYRGGSYRSWLFTIARNRSIDAMRRQKRYPSLSLDATGEDEHSLYSSLPDRSPLPEEILEAKEQAGTIARLIQRLPVVFQQVLQLIDIEEFDYQEAAEVLGLPLGTVKSRLARARLRLRALLLEANYPGFDAAQQ